MHSLYRVLQKDACLRENLSLIPVHCIVDGKHPKVLPTVADRLSAFALSRGLLLPEKQISCAFIHMHACMCEDVGV